ncbi:hypothetical protein C8Q79DRAFT_233046 [Trametes meyenii]|nr:hypothetical protein C8Q79DRAFT_233046 [Trametes meyenii]
MITPWPAPPDVVRGVTANSSRRMHAAQGMCPATPRLSISICGSRGSGLAVDLLRDMFVNGERCGERPRSLTLPRWTRLVGWKHAAAAVVHRVVRPRTRHHWKKCHSHSRTGLYTLRNYLQSQFKSAWLSWKLRVLIMSTVYANAVLSGKPSTRTSLVIVVEVKMISRRRPNQRCKTKHTLHATPVVRPQASGFKYSNSSLEA